MSDTGKKTRGPKQASWRDKRADVLRENLKKRKQFVKGKAQEAQEAQEDKNQD